MDYLGRVAQALNVTFRCLSVMFSDKRTPEFRSFIGNNILIFVPGLSLKAPPLKRIKDGAPKFNILTRSGRIGVVLKLVSR